jgi:hypothetical protein
VSTCPASKLSLYQKGVYYMSIKVFNSLPNWTADLVQNRKIFIGKLKSVWMEQSLYLVNNFLDYFVNLWEIECVW